jgi:hypothetical protein
VFITTAPFQNKESVVDWDELIAIPVKVWPTPVYSCPVLNSIVQLDGEPEGLIVTVYVPGGITTGVVPELLAELTLIFACD